MLNWLVSNLSTIIIALIIAAIVAAIIVHMRRQKKKGMSSCGCNCSTCSACPHGMGTEGTSAPEEK